MRTAIATLGLSGTLPDKREAAAAPRAPLLEIPDDTYAARFGLDDAALDRLRTRHLPFDEDRVFFAVRMAAPARAQRR